MSSSVNGSKGEHSIVTSLDITTNLTTDEVLLPVFCNGPVFILNPSLGSVCADSHISIARVLKNLVFVLKVSVNFNGATGELIVIGIDVFIAKIPFRGVAWDVELCPHCCVLKISKSWFGIGAGRDELFIAEEISVLSSREVALGLTDASSEKILLDEALIHLGSINLSLVLPANTESIINVDIVHCSFQLISIVHACWAQCCIIK